MYFTGKQKLVIGGAILFAVLFVVGSYFGGHWYYGDVEPVEVLQISPPTLLPSQNVTASEVDPDLIGGESLSSPQTESTPTVPPAESESVDDFLAELSDEERALLTAEVLKALPPRESPHGLGPYPEIPPDYPRQNVWAELEESYNKGYATIDHELIHRVLIKLWKRGKKTDSGVLSDRNGRVYPLYKDTVYVKRKEYKDGSVFSMLSHGSLGQYEEAVREGIEPSWIKVIPREDGGIDPYSFLSLP